MDRQTLNKMARSLMDINNALQPIADRYLADKAEEKAVLAFMEEHKDCVDRLRKGGRI